MIVHVTHKSAFEVIAYIEGIGSSRPQSTEKEAIADLCLVLAVKLQETERMLEMKG